MPKIPMIVTAKGAGFYRTRMLQAGDLIRLPRRDAPIHEALGYVTKEAPKAARKVTAAADKATYAAPTTKPAPRKRTRKTGAGK